MRFLKYWWRRFITWFENLFKKTQKEQDLDAPAPLKEDLDAPVPANKQNKGNPLFQRDGVLNPFLGANAPLSQGRVAKERNSVSVAMANGCVANERHYVSNNIKNIGGNNMGNFFGPKTPEECQEEIEKHEQKMKKEMAQIKELEKKKLELEKKEGVTPIKPVGQEKVLPPNISNITMRSNNDNSNWMDPNDLNNTFEYQDEKVQKAMKGVNNRMGELINEKAEKIKQDVKQELKKDMDDRFSESTNDMNKLKEDVKEMKKDITDTKTRLDKYDIMIAEMKQQTEDNKKRIANSERMLEKMEEDKKAHDELMAALWNKLDEWNGIKQPTREGSDNRESTNTSLSSFKYKNPFRNNKRQPKMERADMAHSYDDNE